MLKKPQSLSGGESSSVVVAGVSAEGVVVGAGVGPVVAASLLVGVGDGVVSEDKTGVVVSPLLVVAEDVVASDDVVGVVEVVVSFHCA